MLGIGVLYQQLQDEIGILVVPYLDWRINKSWFLDITMPDRIMLGLNLTERTQISWATYLGLPQK